MLALSLAIWATGRNLGVVAANPGKVAALRYAVSDATRFAETIRGPGDDVAFLIPARSPVSDPTAENILTALREKAKTAEAQDRLWFFWSGHGYNVRGFTQLDSYRVSVDSAESRLFLRDVREIMRGSKAGTKIVVVDACHAGGKGAADSIEDLIKSPGVYTFAASQLEEVGWEFPDIRSGVFTYYLLKGLQRVRTGETPQIQTLGQLGSYVTKAVQQKCREQEVPVQTPVFAPEDMESRVIPKGSIEPVRLEEPQGLRTRQGYVPALLLWVTPDAVGMASYAGRTLRGSLSKLGLSLVSEEKTNALVEDHPSRRVLADKAFAATGAEAVCRVTVDVTTYPASDPLLKGLITAEATISYEVVDVNERVLDSGTTDDKNGGVIVADSSNKLAREKAVRECCDRLLQRLRRSIFQGS